MKLDSIVHIHHFLNIVVCLCEIIYKSFFLLKTDFKIRSLEEIVKCIKKLLIFTQYKIIA